MAMLFVCDRADQRSVLNVKEKPDLRTPWSSKSCGKQDITRRTEMLLSES
jgi:hypothetical protein